MTRCSVPRILLASPSSSSGKTTVMCALLELLRRRGCKVRAFKNGPDYIDPMFYSHILDIPSHNLDLFLLGGGLQGINLARYLLAENALPANIAVLEGAMGFYDGIGTTSDASAYDLAKAVKTPVIVVIDGKGAALTLAAQLRGLAQFRSDSGIAGFIVNNIKPGVYEYYKDTWEKETGLPALGYLPHIPEGTLESRHLGLVTAGEVTDLKERVRYLAEAAAESFDVERILKLAETAPLFSYESPCIEPISKVRFAVARDRAFCFYYEDELRLFEKLGAEIIYFSPLYDTELPPCDGIYLGGGYPELYGKQLEDNISFRQSICTAIEKGIPCFAECGGFMYLLSHFQDGEKTFDWVGAIEGTAYMTDKLTHFGYVTVKAQRDTLLGKAGDMINAHEFHYSDSTNNGDACVAQKVLGKSHWPCVYARGNLFAGYPHMHLWGNIDWARRFIAACYNLRLR